MIMEIGRNYLWVSRTGEQSESQLIDRCDPLVDLRVTLNDKKLFFELLEVAYYVTPIIYMKAPYVCLRRCVYVDYFLVVHDSHWTMEALKQSRENLRPCRQLRST